jgi:hypothetical protein
LEFVSIRSNQFTKQAFLQSLLNHNNEFQKPAESKEQGLRIKFVSQFEFNLVIVNSNDSLGLQKQQWPTTYASNASNDAD